MVPVVGSRKVLFALYLFAVVLASTGCIPTRQARVAAVAFTVEDVARAAAKQTDPTIIRQGTPAYIMLMDGLLEAYPDNKDLLIATSQACSTYASSFLTDDGREEAGALYEKSMNYGFRALSAILGQDFRKASSGNLSDFKALLQKFQKRDVPALFWTASAWANWMSSNIGSVEAMADLPVLEATMARVLELDDTFYYGSPHLLMGVYLAAKPQIMGGDLAKAKSHFERAAALGADKILTSKVLFAEYYARGIKDRNLFVSTLQDVIAARVDQVPELTLANVMAKEKAKRLLEKTEEYFESES